MAKEYSIKELATAKGCSVQAIRDIMRDAKRRESILPGAYVVNPEDHKARWVWRIPDSKALRSWQPRKYKGVRN